MGDKWNTIKYTVLLVKSSTFKLIVGGCRTPILALQDVKQKKRSRKILL